jgi:hypothetical protein
LTGSKNRTCIGCGYSFDEGLDHCPSCGRMFSSGKGPVDPSVPQRAAEYVPAPVAAQPIPTYQYPQPLSQNQYLPPDQYGLNAQYWQQGQHAPPDHGPKAGQVCPAPPGPGYGQYPYPQPQYPSGKNPRMATVFAAVLGLFGLMGVGHLYMRNTLSA